MNWTRLTNSWLVISGVDCDPRGPTIKGTSVDFNLKLKLILLERFETMKQHLKIFLNVKYPQVAFHCRTVKNSCN